MAWRLVWVMTIIVLCGTATLIDYGTRANHVAVSYLPIGQWNFDRRPIEIGGCFGCPMLLVGWTVGLGPLQVSWPNRIGRAFQ